MTEELSENGMTKREKHLEEQFSLFWRAYPKKVGKGEAKKYFKKIAPSEELFDKILSAIEKAKQTRQWQKDNGQYIPHPTTWLRQERWDDDYSYENSPTLEASTNPLDELENTNRAMHSKIENYNINNSSNEYQKQVHDFLHNDSTSEKEELFEALEPVITDFWRDKGNCETPQERKFFIAYTAVLLKNRHFNDGYYRLDPQKEIEGSIAKVKPYRVDFLNEKSKVIVEINGSVHNTDEQRKYDRNRAEELFNLGYFIMNFTNGEVERNAYECAREAMEAIEKQLEVRNLCR